MSPSQPHDNPYPGLRAFEPDEAELFFGRERETDELRRRLRTSPLLAVVGTSGSGKSSLVRCGLVPSLHGGFMAGAGSNWRVAITRPGEDPIGRLSEALNRPEILGHNEAHADEHRTMLEVTLRDSSLGLAEAVRQAQLPPSENVLVVVDQFEELFRFRRSRAERARADDAVAFVRLLLDASRRNGPPIFVVITMRSEFIGECVAFDRLPEAINAGQYLVPRMSRDEMRAAIAGPASVRGASIAPRLLSRLLNEVGDDLDRLPVLQHALMRTWDRWALDHVEGEMIDVRHYEEIGTMSDALSRHAEQAFAELNSESERRIAERLFKTLTESTDEGHGVRRPTSVQRLSDVCGTSLVRLETVIDRFRASDRAFLQPVAGVHLRAEDIVDISHESLMRLWTRLAGWVRDEARSVEIYRRLSRAATQRAVGEASLWRPPELTIGLVWLREAQPTASWAGDETALHEAIDFLRRSRRANRLKRGLVAAAAATTVALALSWLYHKAEVQRREAEAQQEEAQTQRLEAEAQRQKNDLLQAELDRLQSKSIKSALVQRILVPNREVMPSEVLEVKVSPNSSKVRVFGVFAGGTKPQRVEGQFAKTEGGVYLKYRIPADAKPGERSAWIYVQEIGSSREEKVEEPYTVVLKH